MGVSGALLCSGDIWWSVEDLQQHWLHELQSRGGLVAAWSEPQLHQRQSGCSQMWRHWWSGGSRGPTIALPLSLFFPALQLRQCWSFRYYTAYNTEVITEIITMPNRCLKVCGLVSSDIPLVKMFYFEKISLCNSIQLKWLEFLQSSMKPHFTKETVAAWSVQYFYDISRCVCAFCSF